MTLSELDYYLKKINRNDLQEIERFIYRQNNQIIRLVKKENEINVSAFEEVKTKKHFEKTELMELDNSLNQIDESEEKTVLLGDLNKPINKVSNESASFNYPKLVRLSTNEIIVIDKPVFPTVINAREIISVDLGLKEFGVFGNLEESIPVPNPRWIQVHAKRLRRFQQSLSRKQYDHKTHTGSKNWEKARAKVAKEQRKIADQRRDFHHKLSRAITDNCVAFICEDLAVKNMMKSRHLSKSIASVVWSQFLSMVQYKMERAGKYFIKISRWYPSSQTCGCCGYKNTDVKDLGVRKWKCPKCGTWHDRALNAQQNIYKSGAKMLQDEGIQIVGLPVTSKSAN